MTSEQLIEEGRRLQRPCLFLRPQKNGPVAALWYENNEDENDATGERCWLSVDASHVPCLPSSVTGYLSVFTNEHEAVGGRVAVTPAWPEQTGTPLYAHVASVLPPIEAVFARGSEAVSAWLESHGWDRRERYNDNFPDAVVVREYERIWQREYPLYLDDDLYAMLGGWPFPMADDDWYDLLDDQLLVLTLRDSEPWVEAWRTQEGEYRVIQRRT